MTDHERAALDALADYSAKLQHCDECEKAARIAHDEMQVAWNVIQRLARIEEKDARPPR